VRRAAPLLLLLVLAACSTSRAAAPSPTSTPTSTPAAGTPEPQATATPPHRVVTRGTFTIAFAGDVHFEGAIQQHLHADPAGVFGDMIPVLSAADLTVANLETAITEGGNAQEKQYVFRAPATAFDALRASGIDVVSDANNHGLDYGQVGFQDTLAAARLKGYPVIGSGRDEDAAYAPYRATLHGWRVAVLGASQVIAPELVGDWTAGPNHPGIASAYRVERLTRAVREAAGSADVVVVYLHWGVERDSCPSTRQRTLARQLLDAGADVVVGSHAHVVQGSGFLHTDTGKGYVAYGLGNFLFYATGSGPSTQTSVLTLTLNGPRTVKAVRTPARLRSGWTTPLTGQAAVREVARQEALRSCAGLAAS
jgi:poly-gamma-glutamate capsule biosynthesis protein CapA/YwtB (metallophosphatase superfamily)